MGLKQSRALQLAACGLSQRQTVTRLDAELGQGERFV